MSKWDGRYPYHCKYCGENSNHGFSNNICPSHICQYAGKMEERNKIEAEVVIKKEKESFINRQEKLIEQNEKIIELLEKIYYKQLNI